MTQNSTLREAFNSRQFDAMKAAQLRAEFYDEVCPEHSTIAWDIFLETCLTLIHRSYSFPDCDAQRDETLRRINSIVVKIGFNKLRLKTRIKLRMLQLGVPIYSVLMKTYIELDGFIRRTKTNLKGIRKE